MEEGREVKTVDLEVHELKPPEAFCLSLNSMVLCGGGETVEPGISGLNHLCH